MSKAVLISIQPKWCELIASGKKTIEVRKSRPSIETPFKCYIYCTQHKYHHLYDLRKVSNGTLSLSVVEHNKTSLVADGFLNGKVIGEFVCDRIDSYIKEENNRYWWTFCSPEEIEEIKRGTCLTINQIVDYTGDSKRLYGWHISDLVIYDKPRELGEFTIRKKCDSCKRSGYESTACRYDEDCLVPAVISRPPQSWMYVEDEIC